MKLIGVSLICIVISNMVFGQDTLYNAVIQRLFRIDELDQRYRNQIEYTENKYGKGSKEIKALYQHMQLTDSLNLKSVDSIIEKYGWLGYNEIGSQANTALFMVVQHSNPLTWRKYLPIMAAAVKNGKARASEFALLQDRLDLHEGRKQQYGSQLFWSSAYNRYFVFPLIDPESVDVRRAQVGLPSISAYLKAMDIVWDVEQYKRDLPMIMMEWKRISPRE